MRRALAGVDVWVTGLTRSQSASRAALEVVAWDWQYQLVKVNPARRPGPGPRCGTTCAAATCPTTSCTSGATPSIGCTHCTAPVPGNELGEYSREGRWTGEHKTECGLHRITPRVRITS